MKKALRQEILAARSSITPEERRVKSREIAEKLFALHEFQIAGTVLFYASFRSEVETHDMVRRALKCGKRVALPRVMGKELAVFEIGDFDRDVRPGAWGIPEPAPDRPVRPESIDMIIVPGAAFDPHGNRLGYGAGFYDKLLKGFHGATAAVAFELQIVPSVPADPHDVPMQMIVTEQRIIAAK